MQANTTASPLEGFRARFEEIQGIKDSFIRSARLSALMTDMEDVYSIPQTGMLRRTAFVQAYPGVMELYKKVSYARPL